LERKRHLGMHGGAHAQPQACQIIGAGRVGRALAAASSKEYAANL
jgi:hypothetical protein